MHIRSRLVRRFAKTIPYRRRVQVTYCDVMGVRTMQVLGTPALVRSDVLYIRTEDQALQPIPIANLVMIEAFPAPASSPLMSQPAVSGEKSAAEAMVKSEAPRPGRVWCRHCSATLRVNATVCATRGWPECCGATMSLEAPRRREGMWIGD